jgi:hypothetical protein
MLSLARLDEPLLPQKLGRVYDQSVDLLNTSISQLY